MFEILEKKPSCHTLFGHPRLSMLSNQTSLCLCYSPEATGHDMTHLADAQALRDILPTVKQQGQHTGLRPCSLEFTSGYVSLGSNVKQWFSCLTAFLKMAGCWKMLLSLRLWRHYQ